MSEQKKDSIFKSEKRNVQGAKKKGKSKGNENIFVKNAGNVSISKLNATIVRQLGMDVVETVTEKKQGNPLAKYEEAKAQKKTITVSFDSCDKTGNFSTYDENGVFIVLSGDQVADVQGVSNTRATGRMLGMEMKLYIKKIDEEKQTIYCEIPRSVKAIAQNTVRDNINRELGRMVDAGKTPVVWGRIIKVDAKKALVDILGQGVRGLVDTAYWQPGFTRSMIGMCEVGEYFQFEVRKRGILKSPNQEPYWLLSRKELARDAWQDINYSNLEKGGVLLVKCIEKPVEKSYWWGVSDRLPGVELMGDYNSTYRQNGLMVEGITYKCNIKEIVMPTETTRGKIKVAPFDVISSDYAKLEKVKALLGVKQKISDN